MKIDNNFVKKGEVYLYWIGRNEAVGTEIQKIRPAVVVSSNSLNKWNYRHIVVPITKRKEKFIDFEVPVRVCGKEDLAMIDQIKTVDISPNQKVRKFNLRRNETNKKNDRSNFLNIIKSF
jgi:mRNA interferase MazF